MISELDIKDQLSNAEIEGVVAEEIAKRKRSEYVPGGAEATIGGALASSLGGSLVHKGLVDELMDEFEDIRTDPARRSKQADQMVRTYEKYLAQGNDPVELFIPQKDFWAAWQDKDGNDVVWYDPTAPHPAVMAHELGHVQMNHSNDPLSQLQQSGLGKLSGALSLPIGLTSGAAGYHIGNTVGRGRLGGALGALVGGIGSSGNFAYELGGASKRALDYLPDDVDQTDAAGDLVRAGMTYGMQGPVYGALAGVGGAGIAAALSRGKRNRMAGEAIANLA